MQGMEIHEIKFELNSNKFLINLNQTNHRKLPILEITTTKSREEDTREFFFDFLNVHRHKEECMRRLVCLKNLRVFVFSFFMALSPLVLIVDDRRTKLIKNLDLKRASCLYYVNKKKKRK